MATIREWARRLWGTLRRRRHDADLEAELRVHLELEEEGLRRQGHSPGEAARLARLHAGRVPQAMEAVRDQRGLSWLDELGRDSRYGLRALRRSPAFTTVAVITLAIGIGATTAIFNVVNGILLKPLPYPEPEALIALTHTAPGLGVDELGPSPTMYFTYCEEGRAFRDLGLWSGGTSTVTGLREPERVRTLRVTYGTLQALAVPPALGRWISEADDTPGTPETVMLTYGYWQRAFGGDPSIVGRSLIVDSRPRDVVGVMPQGFRFLDVDADMIVPLRFDREGLVLGNFSFRGLARLDAGTTLSDANTDVARMLPGWLRAWPAPQGFDRAIFESAGIQPAFQTLKTQVVGDIGDTLWVLMGTIGVVLLIACANVANLLLVRVEGRQQELATRAALGAGRGRLAREQLLESLLLGLIGGAVGVGLAYGALQLLVSISPGDLPRLSEVAIDPLVLGFALAASIGSGLLFGAVPAFKSAGQRLVAARHGHLRTASHSREWLRARNVLVVVQVALALVLLISSGLMIRTFQTMLGVQPGFSDPGDVQLVRISIPSAQLDDPERVLRMHNDILDRVSALPGVESAALSSEVPMEGFEIADVLFAEDRAYGVGEIPPIREFKFVSPALFQTLGTPLVAGRDIRWTDVYNGARVAIVSANLAREMWGDPMAALGKRIRSSTADPWREIIGVVGDLHDNGVHEPTPATVYWPARMTDFWGGGYVARAATYAIRTDRAGTEAFLAQLREAVWDVNPNLPLAQVRTLETVYDQSMARTSFTVVMLGLAGLTALLLGIVGIYGVISYTVSQRTREIGIRLALGERQAEIKRMFVRQALLMAGGGVVAGVAGAISVTRLLSSLLFEVSPLDPLTDGTVSVALVATAVLASYVPARRAAALDPVEALRAE